jgi:hypothetical protein
VCIKKIKYIKQARSYAEARKHVLPHHFDPKKKEEREREREREREERGRQKRIHTDIEESFIVCVLLLCYFFTSWKSTLNNIHVIPFEFNSGIIPLYSGPFG